MPASKLVIVEVDPREAGAASLIAALDNELLDRYPGMPIHGINAAEFQSNGGIFLLGTLDQAAVAFGALRPFNNDVCELKRMFVRKDQRGHGFGKAILAALEERAARNGYRAIKLETGIEQPEAIALYEGAGYQAIECFGEYTSDSRSRCFEKRLPRRVPAQG